MAISNPLAALFKRSPFKAMQEHMRCAVECARLVDPLFEAVIAGDQDKVEVIKEKIFEIENQADQIKNRLRANLPRSLFMPVDRRDLLEVLQMQDAIADTAQDIAGLLVERPMDVPEPMQKPLMQLTTRCIDVCEQSAKVIEELDELLEMGFRGREAKQVEAMVDELGRMEDEADELELQLTRILFQHEDEINPVSVMMWYRLIEWTGDLADYAEKVGNRLRLLIAR